MIIIPCLFTVLSPFFIIVACLGHILKKYKRDWNETSFIERWQWEEGQNPITIIILCIFYYLLSYLPITIFHKCCLSGPYLERYKRDWNETWFIERWQWEEGQNPRTIILPCIFIELSPLNLVFVIMDVCPGHILKVQKGLKWNLVHR